METSFSETPSISPLGKFPPELLPYRLPLRMADSLKQSVKLYVQAFQSQLRILHQEKFPIDSLILLNTLYLDDLIITLFERFQWNFGEDHPDINPACALLAVGGYGRREMNFRSDIDLLLVYSEKSEEYLNALMDALLYPLWDAGLEVGYAVRSFEECQQIMAQDATALSSMLDVRHLAGDSQSTTQFFQLRDQYLDSIENLRAFIKAKNLENQERRKKYGSSVYLLEPNVKEGEGALRDYHTLLWFTKIRDHFDKAPRNSRLSEFADQMESLQLERFLTSDFLQQLKEARTFLWQVRSAIHFRSKRKYDQLSFQFQEEISKELGYQADGEILAVENFMQAYYRHAANIKRVVQWAVPNLLENIIEHTTAHTEAQEHRGPFLISEGKIFLDDLTTFQKDPFALLKPFLWIQKEGFTLAESTRKAMTENLDSINADFIKRPQTQQFLRELFGDLLGLGDTLFLLHELGLLERLVPEFGEVVCRVQHDAYHVYTVDTHSIFAVRELSKLKAGIYDAEFPLFKKALEKIPHLELLAWGTFFHDVGKGRGKNHSIVGAEMAVCATQRMGYSDKEIETVEFLVKSHLLMPHLSQRRDLDDTNLIAQFGKAMQNLDYLNMLFVLTWADIRAVGPDVWTPWKGNLLSELYNRTYQVLETGTLPREQIGQRITQVKESLFSQVAEASERELLPSYLQNMPNSYWLSHTPQEIGRHFELFLISQQGSIALQMGHLASEKANELQLYTLTTPALLSKIAGVLAANDLNILEVRQHLSKLGWVLLLVKFTDAQGQPIEEVRRFENLKFEIQEVLEGKIKVNRLIESREKPEWLKTKIIRQLPPRIEIDNDVSAYYTVIDIYANDRIGLLYEILSTLSSLGLYVDVSKISTKVDQAVDVFYVKDIFGQKITQSEKLKKVEYELLRAIG